MLQGLNFATNGLPYMRSVSNQLSVKAWEKVVQELLES